MITVFKCIFPDGKVYIGSTKRSLTAFIKWCKSKKKNPNTIFLWAISKYDLNDLKWIEIGQYWTIKTSSEVVRNLIKQENSNNREFGYNYLNEKSEKTAVSRAKTRLNKLLSKIENKKLRNRILSVINDCDKYLKKSKDLK